MIATYKCYEIKNQVLASYSQDLDLITTSTEKAYDPEFPATARKILREACTKFNNNAKNYPEVVTIQVQEDIINILLERLGTSFAYQLKNTSKSLIEKFRLTNSEELKRSK